jgi:hypothetical protein
LEVLTAILITGVGLLALLALFPLGALDMARNIKDDRAAAVAAEAAALGDAGEALLARTWDYVAASLSNGSADPKVAATLEAEAEALAVKAAQIEAQLRQLRPLAPNPPVVRQLDRLLRQIRTIKSELDRLAELFRLLAPA